MKRTLIALLGMAAALSLYGQNLILEAGGGLARQMSGSTHNVGAYKLGLGLEFEVGQTWAIEPALVYYGKGWREKDETIIYRDDNGDPILDEDPEEPLTGTRRTTYSAGYVELPVLIHYYLRTAEAQYLKFSAGPYVAYGVSGKMKVQGDADRQGDDDAQRGVQVDGRRQHDGDCRAREVAEKGHRLPEPQPSLHCRFLLSLCCILLYPPPCNKIVLLLYPFCNKRRVRGRRGLQGRRTAHATYARA